MASSLLFDSCCSKHELSLHHVALQILFFFFFSQGHRNVAVDRGARNSGSAKSLTGFFFFVVFLCTIKA